MNEQEVKKILETIVRNPLRLAEPEINIVVKEICQLFEPYPEALWQDDEQPCFWCKTPTHWIDIDYQGRVCDQQCQREIAQDVKRLSEKPK